MTMNFMQIEDLNTSDEADRLIRDAARGDAAHFNSAEEVVARLAFEAALESYEMHGDGGDLGGEAVAQAFLYCENMPDLRLSFWRIESLIGRQQQQHERGAQ